MRTAIAISLSKTEREALRRLARRSAVRLAQRANIVLLAADGMQNKRIAEQLGTDEQTVGRWRVRFAANRFAGIQHDAPRPGRKRRVRRRYEARIRKMLGAAAAKSATTSFRAVARALGVNHMLVYRVAKECAGANPKG